MNTETPNTHEEDEDVDDFPFQSLQQVMRAFMRTHQPCPPNKLQFFTQMWELYGDYHLNVEYHGGAEFEAQVLKYLQDH